MTDTEIKPSRLLSIGSRVLAGLAVAAVIALPIVLGVMLANESQRAQYWRGLFIEQCIEDTACDVQEEIAAGPAGPAGEPGIPGPTGPEGPRGLPGTPGDDGEDGAAGESGPAGATGGAGADGEPGASGADGASGQDGAQGATGPTGAQGDTGATGPQGPAGPAGANGSDGRGIASLMCGDDGRWTVTYTDGSNSDAGVCRTDPAPTPDPEPTDPPIIDLGL